MSYSPLQENLYKDTTTNRGFKYHYYFAAPRGSKPTLLFVHGFPSTSQDWHRIVPYFERKGYGVLVPDMLGYGGTDKPTDPAAYKGTLLAKDIVDILTAEKIDKAIAAGHDWGSVVVSRLSSVAPERFYAYAYFAVGHVTPDPTFDAERVLQFTKQALGYELFGYQIFLSEEGADKLLEQHWDKMFGIIFPHDPELWKTHLAPLGALKSTLLADETFPLPPYLSEKDKESMSKAILKGGLAGPVCYYRVQTGGSRTEDDKTIHEDRYVPPASSPIFFAAALKDCICLHDFQKKTFENPVFKDHDIMIRDFEADHWLILSIPDKINEEFGPWVEGVASKIPSGSL